MESRIIGFIGLGEMGKPMAKNLLKKGHKLIVCDVRKEPVEELKTLGAETSDSPDQLAKSSNIIIVMVRDTTQTDEVIYGKGKFWKNKGIWSGIQTGSILLICSSIDPSYCQKLAAIVKEKGVFVLDSPVSGGAFSAAEGKLTFMIGGDKTVVDSCLPIFQAMGKNIFHLGGPGMGQTFKLVNNFMMVINSFGTSEAIALGLKAGLSLDKILEVTKVSSGNSSIVQNWDLMMAFKKDYEVRKDSSTIGGIFFKDLALGLKLANELRVSTPLGKYVYKMDPAKLFPTEPPD